MTDKPLIYAVDDESSIRELYSCALESSGFEAVCFEDARQLFSALASRLPDLILLDIMLEGMDGFEILKAIRSNQTTSAIPVIMVSAKGEEVSKVKGLNLGADDYIAKPFGVLELGARINANLRKRNNVQPFVQSSYKDILVDDKTHTISIGNAPLTLTLKEYELLKLLVSNAPNIVSREEIFRCVWGENYCGETRTLDMHIASLRKIISESSAYIDTVRGVGYILK